MQKKATVRTALDGDFSRVMALYRILEGAYQAHNGEVPDYRLLWWQTLADKQQHLLVAEIDGRVVGTATVIIVPNLGHHGRPWAAVENVVVEPDHRKGGVGAELMKEAYLIARSNRCYKLVLTSNLSRKDAHDFYLGLGWRQSHVGFSLD
ncbi:MAG: GNAT family N-acetyltransferase [Firmicutes bacterium]|nr:GNAT family N-acetyltransferase [Bacillota bacterium]